MSVDFIDSNAVLCLFDETAPRKRAAAESRLTEGLQDGQRIEGLVVVNALRA
jgi:hypothetical protein